MSDTLEQPPPEGGRVAVTPIAREMFLRMLEHQEQKGIARYGTPLQTHNGRDAYLDALGEMVDAVQYLCQARYESVELRKENGELREACYKALRHIEGTATTFSEREKSPVLYRLRKALGEEE